jgi:hypothetical protein
MEEAIGDARAAVNAAESIGGDAGTLSFDPETRLEETFAGIMSGGAGLVPGSSSPALSERYFFSCGCAADYFNFTAHC